MKLIIVALALLASVTHCRAQDLPCGLLPSGFPEPAGNLFTVENDITTSQEGLGVLEMKLNISSPVPVKIISNEEIEKSLISIVQHLITKAPANATRFQYKIMLYDDSVPNALAVPGGVILVSLGLVALAPTDDFLAFILAHEIGHIALRHTTRRETMYALSDLEIEMVEKKIKRKKPGSAKRIQYELLLEELRLRRREQRQLRLKHEIEADLYGAVIALRVGYNPTSMRHYYEKPPTSYEWGWNEWASHPHNFNRVLMYSCLAPRELPAEKLSPELESAKIRAKQLLADKKPR
jgi:beta-barrel assembly-enhancing protease